MYAFQTQIENYLYITQLQVTTALLMNAALRIFSSTPKKLQDLSEIKDEDAKKLARVENYVTVAFSALVTITILSGMYTTITFSLLALYSKTALGMSIDEKYIEFFRMTEPIRQIGFDTYLISLLCFKGRSEEHTSELQSP